MFEKRPRIFGIGGSLPPKRDLTHFVSWPKYVKLQRQKRVLTNRLKMPPQINLFNKTIEKNQAAQLFKLLAKYRPEDKSMKKARLLAIANSRKEAKAADQPKAKKPEKTKKPLTVKYGINHITALVEQHKAKLVVIAHDVDPLELVLWLPALCRKNGVPFAIVKGKARLGAVVHKKNATALALTGVRQEDNNEFSQLVSAFQGKYFDKWDDLRKQWGGGKLGVKSLAAKKKKQKAVAKEQKAIAKA